MRWFAGCGRYLGVWARLCFVFLIGAVCAVLLVGLVEVFWVVVS